MSMYVLTGAFNLLATSPSALIVSSGSPAVDSLFPLTNVYDGDPRSICKFGSSTTNPGFQIDLDYLLGTGNMENFVDVNTPPLGWTEVNSGTGDVVRTVTVHSGSFAAAFTSGTGTASMYYDFTVRAGQRLRFDGWIRGDGGTGILEVLLQNLQTGNYIDGSNGVWSSSAINSVTSELGTSYTHKTVDLAVESYSVCRSDTVVLRLTLANRSGGGSTNAYADDVFLIPGVTFSSVHGHNVDPKCAVQLRSSTDAFSGSDTLEATFTVTQPSFYTTITETFRRYWQLRLSGTQSTSTGAWWIGEWVLGQYYTLAKGPSYSLEMGHLDPQIRVPKRTGAADTYRLAQANQRVLPLTFRCENMTQRLEILQELFERSRGGAPLVAVPHHTDSFTEVILGRLTNDLPHSWPTKDYVVLQTQVEEMAFSLITSG